MSTAKRAVIEHVVWRDHWAGWHTAPGEPKDIEPGMTLAVCGYVVKETRDELILASEMNCDPEDKRVKHVHGIMKKAIVSRRKITVSLKGS